MEMGEFSAATSKTGTPPNQWINNDVKTEEEPCNARLCCRIQVRGGQDQGGTQADHKGAQYPKKRPHRTLPSSPDEVRVHAGAINGVSLDQYVPCFQGTSQWL